MEIRQTKEDHYLIIAINGELDASSSITLDKAMRTALDNGEQILLIDCAQLEYISSPGLGVFMSYLRELEEKTAQMLLYNLKENVQSTFRILGLDELVRIAPDKSTALNEIKK